MHVVLNGTQFDTKDITSLRSFMYLSMAVTCYFHHDIGVKNAESIYRLEHSL